MKSGPWEKIGRIDDIFGMASMAFIILLASANVFMRYAIGKPWAWVEEVTIFTFVWLTMFGAATVIKVEGHCSIDVLARRLSPRHRRKLDVVVDVIVIVTLLLLIWYGTLLAVKAMTKTTPMLGIPYTFVDAAIPVSCLVMLVRYLRQLRSNWAGRNSHDGEEGRT